MICTPFTPNRTQIRKIEYQRQLLHGELHKLRLKKKHTPKDCERVTIIKWQLAVCARVLRDLRQR